MPSPIGPKRSGQVPRITSIAQLKEALAPTLRSMFGLSLSNLHPKHRINRWLRTVFRMKIPLNRVIAALKNVNHGLTQMLVKDLIMDKTSFFRDPAQYAMFLEVFSRLFQGRKDPVRILVPGCSDGREAYTVAIILKENGYADLGIPIEIIATDVSAQRIREAERGEYYYLDPRLGHNNGNDRIIEMHSGYFLNGDLYRVQPEIRAMVTFQVDNMLATKIKGSFDLVSCHHVIEHIRSERWQRAEESLIGKLKPEGYLVSNHAFPQRNDLEQIKAARSEDGRPLYAAYKLVK